MAHWPKTLLGNILAVPLALLVLGLFVQLAIGLSGPVVWIGLAFVAVISIVAFFWVERSRRANDLLVAGAPSFGDVLAEKRRSIDPT